MNIPDDILAPLDTDIRTAIQLALAAHQTTGRAATFAIKGAVKFDKESGKTKIKARVHAGLPEGDDDARAKRWPGVVLMTVAADHPGQQRIEE